MGLESYSFVSLLLRDARCDRVKRDAGQLALAISSVPKFVQQFVPDGVERRGLRPVLRPGDRQMFHHSDSHHHGNGASGSVLQPDGGAPAAPFQFFFARYSTTAPAWELWAAGSLWFARAH